MATESIVGIDLGTSNSAVAYCDASGNPRVLADESGTKIHPSVVSFHPNGNVVIGAEAKQRKVLDPRNTVYSAKRLIGRTFRSSQVQTAIERMPYQIKEGPNQQPVIATRAGEFSVPEISAIILDRLHTIAKTALRNEASSAVITVPANFTEAQRSATATAGAIAGLTVVRVLNEPTAAALAYGHQRRLSQTIAVYDFGGGTFDVTVLRLSDQVFEVLGTAGDSFLGGDDIDERVVDQLVDGFLAEHRVDLRDNEIAMMRLRAVAEQTKIELSRRQKAIIRVDELAYGPGGAPLHMQHELTRADLVGRVADIIERTFPVCQEALKIAGLPASKIDDVVLVGGTTKMPAVRDRVAEFFGRLPRTDVNPEEAVALGAGLQAASLERILSGRPATVPPVFVSPGVGAAEPDPDAARIHRAPSTGFTEDGATQVSGAHARPGGPRAETAPLPAGITPPARTTAPRVSQPGAAIDRFTPPAPPAPPSGPAIGRIATRSVGVAPITAPLPVQSRPPSTPTAQGPAAAPTGTTGRMPTVPPPLIGRPPTIPPRIGRPATIPPLPPGARTQPGLSTIDLGIDQDPGRTDQAMPPPPPPLPELHDLPLDGATQPALPAPALSAWGAPASPSATARGMGPAIADVTPAGLGIATVGGYCESLIRRNDRIPTQHKREFSTATDLQRSVRIVIFQGESRRVEGNAVLGELVLDGLEPRPRGETTIEVTFALDASGILQVAARDSLTGRSQQARLNVVGTMAAPEVEAARSRLQQLR